MFTAFSLRLGMLILEKVQRFGVAKFRDSIQEKAKHTYCCQKNKKSQYKEISLAEYADTNYNSI